MNLLKETINMLLDHEKTTDDVVWCGSNKQWFTWQEFEALANVKYNNSYGGAEVSESLKIVGEDFWLERYEYDGAEWWEFKEFPKKPMNHIVPPSVLQENYDDPLEV